jgi:hypothetical protein
MFLIAVLWQFLTYNGFPNDHYYHVARARQMLLGEWPVRDFVDPGAPLQYVISAVSRWLFGDVAGSELLVVAIGVAVGAAATVVCGSWLARSTVVASGMALLEILASPRTYSYPKMLLYGLAACVIVAVAAQASRRRLLIAAALTAVAFLMRHDHGPLHRRRLRGGDRAECSRPCRCRATAGAVCRCGHGVAGAVGGLGAVLPGAHPVLRDGESPSRGES